MKWKAFRSLHTVGCTLPQGLAIWTSKVGWGTSRVWRSGPRDKAWALQKSIDQRWSNILQKLFLIRWRSYLFLHAYRNSNNVFFASPSLLYGHNLRHHFFLIFSPTFPNLILCYDKNTPRADLTFISSLKEVFMIVMLTFCVNNGADKRCIGLAVYGCSFPSINESP